MVCLGVGCKDVGCKDVGCKGVGCLDRHRHYRQGQNKIHKFFDSVSSSKFPMTSNCILPYSCVWNKVEGHNMLKKEETDL